MTPNQEFVVLLAHGSSDPQWLLPFSELECHIRRSETAVRLAYMELAEPSLEEVVAEACHQGYRSFVILPLFFAAGRHLRQDVPRQIEDLSQRLAVEIRMLPPVGDHPLLVDALLRIVRESLYAANRP